MDSHRSAYVAGQTASTDFPTKNAFQKKLKSPAGNAFVTKFAPDGTALVYSTYLGGPSNGCSNCGLLGDSATSIGVDAYTNAYVVGWTDSKNFPTTNAFQPVYGGGVADAFVTKIDAADCALVYSSYLGGRVVDMGIGGAVDKTGNVYITGSTSSSNFPTKNAFQSGLSSMFGNAFVTKVSAK